MSRLIPAAERIRRARGLIEKARLVPVPSELGRHNLAYVAAVKDLMQQARDLVKLIPYTPSASEEMKSEVRQIMADTVSVEKEILHPGSEITG